MNILCRMSMVYAPKIVYGVGITFAVLKIANANIVACIGSPEICANGIPNYKDRLKCSMHTLH